MPTDPVPISKKRKAPQPADTDWGALLNTQEKEDACSWQWADSEELLDAVVSATEDGAALLLSKTSDGGALCIQVWAGTDRFKLYPASSEEVSIVLATIRQIPHAPKNGHK